MSTVDEVILWGGTGQAKVLYECLGAESRNVRAVFDANAQLKPPIPGVPLHFGRDGLQAWLKERTSKRIGFLVAIGGDRGRVRLEIQGYLESLGLTALIARHESAFVAGNAQIGAGSQVLAQSAICAEATLGKACIINTGATVDHECQLDDGVHVAPGAHLAGCVLVGRHAMIGTGAIVLPRMKIGEDSIVGAGAVVTRDVPPRTVVVGNPARTYKQVA